MVLLSHFAALPQVGMFNRGGGLLVFLPLFLGHLLVLFPVIRLIVFADVDGDIVIINNLVDHSLFIVIAFLPMPSVPLLCMPHVGLITNICHILRMVVTLHGVRLLINLIRIVVMGIQMSMVMEFIMHPIKRTPPVNVEGWIRQKRLGGSMISIISHTCWAHTISVVMYIQTPVVRRKNNFAGAVTTYKIRVTVDPCPPIKPVIKHVIVNNDWHVLIVIIVAVSIVIIFIIIVIVMFVITVTGHGAAK